MDFCKEQQIKRRLTGSSAAFQVKTTGSLAPQPNTPHSSKGKVRVEQYEYDEENKLGEGFTSKVYLGRRVDSPKNEYAIKVVDKRRLGKSKQNLELLKQEMQVHAQLDHPNVVKCHDIIEKTNFYYFVLEYCPHGTLDSFIKKHHALSETAALAILEQVAAGYRYLMRQKVLHRDLKPPNILKSGPNWKIGDFGFSVIGKKSYLGQVNVGTPAYMAPEALERTYYSPKTDFFSLGVLCYEMLFGVTPWQHKNEKLLLQMIKENNLHQRLQTIQNPNLALFIRQCCEPNQRKRISPEQFENFCFWKQPQKPHLSDQPEPLKDKTKHLGLFTAILNNHFIKDDPSTCYSKTSSHNTSVINLPKNERKLPPEQLFQGNTAVLEREMYYCTVVYILLKNIHLLQLQQPQQRELFIVLLSKHAGYIIRRIRHRKVNYLCLKRWEEYCAGEAFAKLDSQAEDLLANIHQIVSKEVKRRSIAVIRRINAQFDQLTYDKHLSLPTVNHLRTYLLQFMNRLLLKYQSLDGYLTHNSWTADVLEYLMKYFKYLGEVTATTEQSRAIAIKREFKDRSELTEDLSRSKKSCQEFQCIKQQIAAIRI